MGMKGRVPFEAGDALLALPIASTAGTFLLPPFWQFAVEQIEVEVKDSNPMLRSHCGCQIPARETWLCAGVTAGLSSRLRWKSKTQIQCCEATADAKSLHGRPGCVQELLQDEELLLVFKQVGVCYPHIILYVFVVGGGVLKSVPVCSLIRCV